MAEGGVAWQYPLVKKRYALLRPCARRVARRAVCCIRSRVPTIQSQNERATRPRCFTCALPRRASLHCPMNRDSLA